LEAFDEGNAAVFVAGAAARSPQEREDHTRQVRARRLQVQKHKKMLALLVQKYRY
jgi:hypothetical protein